jgi:hypothetical protein
MRDGQVAKRVQACVNLNQEPAVLMFLQQPAIADHTDRNAFDDQGFATRIHADGRELSILRHQLDDMPLSLDAFHGHFIGQARNDDLSRPEFVRSVHGEQITVQDTCTLHAGAADFEEIVGARLE